MSNTIPSATSNQAVSRSDEDPAGATSHAEDADTSSESASRARVIGSLTEHLMSLPIGQQVVAEVVHDLPFKIGELHVHLKQDNSQRIETNQNLYEHCRFGDSHEQGAESTATDPSTSSECTLVSQNQNDIDCSHTGSKISEMKSALDKRSRAECGKMSNPIQTNLQISRVPLQISRHVQTFLKDLDRHGHYNKRSDFERNFKAPKAEVKLSNIFDTASKKATTLSEHETNNETAKLQYIERHGNIVAMIGQAGIGKTTLTRMVLQHIIDGEMLPDTQFIFYIPFRDVDFVDETTLMRFALTGCCDWEHNDESDKKLLKYLKDNPNVVFIFDGLDEANTDRLSKYFPDCNMDSSKTPDRFVSKILNGKFFPKAKKLLTSRPRQFFDLHPDYRPQFVLDILGLNKEAQLDLCRQICGDSFEVVMKYLESHPDIFLCCYVPVNCIITMNIINETIKEHGAIDVKSLTDIFIRALEAFIQSEHVKEYKGQVWKLSKLAWNAFVDQKFVFNEEDFAKAEITQTVFEAFLCTYVKGGIKGKILEGKKKSCFSHLTWQELFVAIYVMMFLPLEEFRNLVQPNKLNNPLWEVVSKFCFGLCNQSVLKRLDTLFRPNESETWDLKKDILYEFVYSSFKVKETNRYLKEAALRRVFSWMREADCENLNKKIAPIVPKSFEFSSSMSSTDVVSAVYVLKLATTMRRVEISGKNLSPHDLDYLCDQFASFPAKIPSLYLSCNNISDDGAIHFSKCLKSIDELDVSKCNITSVGVEAIANQLEHNKVQSLNLSSNKIGDDGAIHISKCLNNIYKLDVTDCGITSVGVEAIASQLEHNKIKSLFLGGNFIGDEGALHICKCLKNIEELRLTRCKITADGVNAIASGLGQCRIRLKHLSISSNPIGDEGVSAIASCLSKVEELWLICIGLTRHGVQMLRRELGALPTKKPHVVGLALDEQQ